MLWGLGKVNSRASKMCLRTWHVQYMLPWCIKLKGLISFSTDQYLTIRIIVNKHCLSCDNMGYCQDALALTNLWVLVTINKLQLKHIFPAWLRSVDISSKSELLQNWLILPCFGNWDNLNLTASGINIHGHYSKYE